jgi:acetoin utilization deacetylase AcuC-like enzyme
MNGHDPRAHARSQSAPPTIAIIHRDELVPAVDARSFTPSPRKPRLLLEHLGRLGLLEHFTIASAWEPLAIDDFRAIHDDAYVDAFFGGVRPLCESSGIPWSPSLAESVRYTNASLYHAIVHAIDTGGIALSPTSGFHHAQPHRGLGFCTFAGQVLASCRLYRERGLVGAYVDLDGHRGNAIADFARESKVSELVRRAIALDLQPVGRGRAYLDDLRAQLALLEEALATGRVDYVVFAHGADSHEDDEGWNEGERGQCTTEEWVACAELFYGFVRDARRRLGLPIPLALALFGGYRSDDFDAVLNLHTKDLIRALNLCCGRSIEDRLVVSRPDFAFDRV